MTEEAQEYEAGESPLPDPDMLLMRAEAILRAIKGIDEIVDATERRLFAADEWIGRDAADLIRGLFLHARRLILLADSAGHAELDMLEEITDADDDQED